jgi:hypothetical protein
MEAVYPTDLTDDQWQAISRLIPAAKPGGRPRSVNMREVLNALFYLARTGCAWRMLPQGLSAQGYGVLLLQDVLAGRDVRTDTSPYAPPRATAARRASFDFMELAAHSILNGS